MPHGYILWLSVVVISMSSRQASVGTRWSPRLATKKLQALINTIRSDNWVPDVVVDLIQNQGADPNVRCDTSGWTLLMWLCAIGKEEVGGNYHDQMLVLFRWLLDRHDIDVNVEVRGVGNVLLGEAASMRDPMFLQLVLMKGDAQRGINQKLLGDGFTPLLLACQDPVTPIQNIRALIAHGAATNVQCTLYGRTPLHYVMMTYTGDNANGGKVVGILEEFFKYFEGRNAAARVRDNNGQTVLHYAARFVHSARVCELLLGLGGIGSVRARDNRRHLTPLDYARDAGNIEIATVIENYVREWDMRTASLLGRGQ